MDFQKKLDELAKAVFVKRPRLQGIVEKYGDQNLLEYSRKFKNNFISVNTEIKGEFIKEISTYAQLYFDEGTVVSMKQQLEKFYYLSTTDHMGIFGHPFFIHSTILSALASTEKKNENHENVIVLACSNISLNNSSLPLSLVFHNQKSPELEKLNFFSAYNNNASVHSLKAFQPADIKRIYTLLEKRYLQGRYNLKIFKMIERLVKEIYDRPNLFTNTYFSEQMSVANSEIWKKFLFKNQKTIPNLIYLEQETLVLNLLKKHHLFSHTNLHKFIFDPEVAKKIKKAFNDIPGTFSVRKKTGTFFFWFLPSADSRKVALWRKGKSLVSSDGKYKILLTPEKIKELIDSHQLIPSTMLSSVTLTCYYGVKCLGGFNQVDYLSSIKKAYNFIFPSSEVKKDNTLESLCGDFFIGFLKRDGKWLPASGWDFMLYGSKKTHANFKTNSQKLTVKEAIYLMFPDLYNITYNKKRPVLASISQTDIINFLELDKKLLPCFGKN